MQKSLINAPEELKSQKYWGNWYFSPLKNMIPIDNNFNRLIPQFPDDWFTYEQALSNYQNKDSIDGIGFVLDESNDYIGLNIDGCIDDSGKLIPEIAELLDGYDGLVEISPSNKGVKCIFKGTLPNDFPSKCVVKNVLGSDQIGLYTHARYFAVTGVSYNGSMTIGSPDMIINRLRPYFIDTAGSNKDGYNFPIDDAQFDHDAEDLKYCLYLAKQYPFYYKKIDELFRESELMRPKWDSMCGDITYGKQTMLKAFDSVELDSDDMMMNYINFTYKFKKNETDELIEYFIKVPNEKYRPLTFQDMYDILDTLILRGAPIDLDVYNVQDMITEIMDADGYFLDYQEWLEEDYSDLQYNA